MKQQYIVVELFSDMPSNDIKDCKMAGDMFKVSLRDAIRLSDLLTEDHVEFTMDEVGDCLIDKSYKYWE